jgi:glucose/arabinose dehydrogenase
VSRSDERTGGQHERAAREISEGPTIELELVAEGLTHPTGFEVAPEDRDRRFVHDQTGQIYVHEDGELAEEPFLDLADRIVELGSPQLGGYDERGLLGLAFHPDFEENRRFFVRYSAPVRSDTPEEFDHTEVLSEFRATEDLERGAPDSERVVGEIPSPQLNHNAGQIAFGPEDGYLYVTMGDGGGANDVGVGHVDDWYDENRGGNGQNTSDTFLGGIHRVDVDDEGGDDPYGVPDDNPLVDEAGHHDEYYAWGLRNPWRMSFNDGELFVGDLGQNLFEEVNIVEKGGNYGWNVREGTHGFSTQYPLKPPEERPTSTPEDVRGGEELIEPIIEYRHPESTKTVVDGNSVIGGYVYGTLPGESIEGRDEMAPLSGKYVFGNWSKQGVIEPKGGIFAATPPEDGNGLWSLEELQIAGREEGELNEYVQSFGRDAEGDLYVLTSETHEVEGDTGKVYRVASAEANGQTDETDSSDGGDN